MLYGATLTPVLLADLPLLAAVVGFFTLQFALESITGQHRFLSALQKGCVMSACYISPLGTPKVVLAGAAWLCYSIVVTRFHAAQRTSARPIRVWWEALPVLQTGLATAGKADVAALVLCAALSLATLVLSEPEELCRWFGNLLLVLWGGAFGLRFAASSLLQVRCTRGAAPSCASLTNAHLRSCHSTRAAKTRSPACAAAACSAAARCPPFSCCADACSLRRTLERPFFRLGHACREAFRGRHTTVLRRGHAGRCAAPVLKGWRRPGRIERLGR